MFYLDFFASALTEFLVSLVHEQLVETLLQFGALSLFALAVVVVLRGTTRDDALQFLYLHQVKYT